MLRVRDKCCPTGLELIASRLSMLIVVLDVLLLDLCMHAPELQPSLLRCASLLMRGEARRA